MRSPIGVFDSGLGGLSVAAELLHEMPDERIIYFADNAHVPYGERPLEEIRQYALSITGYLIERGCKAVVMACNMSTAAALEAAAERYAPAPVIGVIAPGARAAVEVAAGHPIGVLATTGTVRSEAYVREVQRIDPGQRVVQQACPKFVPLVEAGKAESEEAEAACCTYVSPLTAAGCRTLILGCTHYPFLRKAIATVAGAEVTIVDPAQETVRALRNILCERGMLSDGPGSPHVFCASGDTGGFATLGGAFLGRPIARVETVTWGVDIGQALKDARV